MSARICADICSLLQCLIFSKSKMSALSQQKKTKSEFYTSFCGRPQANLHRAADVRKKIAPADTEKCPQKSAGFDRGTDICGFVADICGHMPTSAMIYAEVRICPQHMPDLLWTLMAIFKFKYTSVFFCFFFVLFSLLFTKKKNRGQTLWGRIAPSLSAKIQEAAIIQVNISAQKEGIVPKTSYIALEHL